MSLVTKIEEVRLSLRLNSLNNDKSLPDMEDAEQKHIIPVIGESLYNRLQSLYSSGSEDKSFLRLIAIVRKPLVAYAYLDNIGLLHATITDAGVRRFGTGDMPSVYAWEFRELTKSLSGKAMSGMELLLEYLDNNSMDWPEWSDSPLWGLRNNLIIKSGKDFSNNYPLYQPCRTYNALLPIIVEVQDNYIIPSVGKPFFDSLFINSGDSSNHEVIRLIKKSVAHYTIKHAVEQLPVSVTELGLTVLTAGNSNDVEYPGKTSASDHLLELKGRAADRDGALYLRKVKSYLNKNASDQLFPLYFRSKYYNNKSNKGFDKGNERRKIFRL